MRRLRRRIPNLTTLAFFEAAGRHMSFSRAATELHVTQGAVSRQIRMLEESLGCALFRRLHRAVELTAEGRRLHHAVTIGLGHIESATDFLADPNDPGRITIAATHAVATLWLMPRIRRLRADFPGHEIQVLATDEELEEIVRSTGFFRSKAKNLMGMAAALVERFDAEVPATMEELVSLPGVGRKTANVVLSVAMGVPGLPVDTHVGRLSRRLGLTTETDPVAVERDLCAMVPAAEWGELSLRLILHGRRVCSARSPRCEDCVLADFCPASTLRP